MVADRRLDAEHHRDLSLCLRTRRARPFRAVPLAVGTGAFGPGGRAEIGRGEIRPAMTEFFEQLPPGLQQAVS